MEQDHARQITHLFSGLKLNENTINCEENARSHDIDSLTLTLIGRGLFLENLSLLPRVSRDSWGLYSYKPNDSNKTHRNSSISSPLEECLARLLRSQPMKSYLKLTLRQVMNFLLSHNDNSQPPGIERFVSFVNEIRTSFDTICVEDRQLLKPPPIPSKPQNKVNPVNLYSEDATFLVNWALIEGAKYCLCHKLAPDIPTKQFLSLLHRETLSSLSSADKISRRFLINLLQNLEKFILDRTLHSSNDKHTFVPMTNVDNFYKANASTFHSWFLKNRQDVAKLCLVSDDPAECWRNICVKLNSDLTAKFLGSDQSTGGDLSVKQTLMSLNSENWRSNLNIFTLCIKQLRDPSLLDGLRCLIEDRGLICEYGPLSAIKSNLEYSFERNYDSLKDIEDPGDQILLELIDACIELDTIDNLIEYIDRLNSERLKSLYRKYLASRSVVPNISALSRIEEVETWLSTWAPITDSECDAPVLQSTQSFFDIIVPTCLNVIGAAPQKERTELINRTEWLISRDFIAQCLFTPAHIDPRVKVYHLVLDLLKDELADIPTVMIEVHKNDLAWCNLLYRMLSNTGIVDREKLDRNKIDLISLNAAKFHSKHENFTRALEIASNLSRRTKSDCIRAQCSLFVLRELRTESEKNSHILNIAKQVNESKTLDKRTEGNLALKLLRSMIKLPATTEADEIKLLHTLTEDQVTAEDRKLTKDSPVERWANFIDSSSLESKAKTLSLFSLRFHEQLSTLNANDPLLDATFSLDLKLMEVLCQIELSKYESLAIGCATRIIEKVVANGSRLSDENYNKFYSEAFIKSTANVWSLIKTTLISVISYEENIIEKWYLGLIAIMREISRRNPYSVLYSVLVNRLDLKNELCLINDKSINVDDDYSSSLLLHPAILDDDFPESSRRVNQCYRKLKFWNSLFDQIKKKTGNDGNWPQIIQETEKFLVEIRKISYLRVEYLKTLTVRIPKKLQGFLDYHTKNINPSSSKTRLEECEHRLKTVCNQSLDSINILLNYEERVEATKLTLHDSWFGKTFKFLLTELRYRISLLAQKKILPFAALESLIKSIVELLALCRNQILEANHSSGHKLFMEVISPVLSRMKPSLIPMPDCCDDVGYQGSVVTIHKISQTVGLIVSKTSPKKLKFTGSDGKSRSFLLKAHEDLRLDQMVMEFFGTVNKIFAGNKPTCNRFSIRRYSVTPVSFRSGLIQWIDAPSICSAYRSWLNGGNGKKVAREIYEQSCESVCESPFSVDQTKHVNCELPQTVQTTDLFYQLLWSITKPTGRPIAKNKPFFGNTVKFRAEFDPSIFQDILERMTELIPRELISNQIWYSSTNAQAFWMKTREFIDSSAAMSIVGYIIGLGDRHPENILIDYRTGQVIHIDYNICFEFGKSLSIPELVPFRLTPNLVNAFGFAGLEGRFTLACRTVLDLLKHNKPTLLYLLNPLSFGFMTLSQNYYRDDGYSSNIADPNKRKSSISIDNRRVIAPPQAPKRSPVSQPELEMCSQESAGLGGTDTEDGSCQKSEAGPLDVNDMLIMGNTKSGASSKITGEDKTLRKAAIVKPVRDEVLIPSFEFQHNIKTPTKISDATANEIYYRIKDKLFGTDEVLRQSEHQANFRGQNVRKLLDLNDSLQPPNSNSDADKSSPFSLSQPLDLILLNDAQSTEDQVDALIMEALSEKNKAAMFEGWAPWV